MSAAKTSSTDPVLENLNRLLSDLEALFHGHGLRSADPWYVMVIEPNHAGASAIAAHWEALLRG